MARKKCCGKFHESNFCPICGKKLRQVHPFESLLREVEDKLKSVANKAFHLEEQLKSDKRPGIARVDAERDLAAAKKLMAKYDSWIVEINKSLGDSRGRK